MWPANRRRTWWECHAPPAHLSLSPSLQHPASAMTKELTAHKLESSPSIWKTARPPVRPSVRRGWHSSKQRPCLNVLSRRKWHFSYAHFSREVVVVVVADVVGHVSTRLAACFPICSRHCQGVDLLIYCWAPQGHTIAEVCPAIVASGSKWIWVWDTILYFFMAIYIWDSMIWCYSNCIIAECLTLEALILTGSNLIYLLDSRFYI